MPQANLKEALSASSGKNCLQEVAQLHEYINNSRWNKDNKENKLTEDGIKSAVVFCYGPNKAATAEIQLVRVSKILDILPPGKKLLAEGGFVGATAKQLPATVGGWKQPFHGWKASRWNFQAVSLRVLRFRS